MIRGSSTPCTACAIWWPHSSRRTGLFKLRVTANCSGTFGPPSALEPRGPGCRHHGGNGSGAFPRPIPVSNLQVNIDDELYVQEDEDNTATELVFDEFEEIVGRMFHLREWMQARQVAPPSLPVITTAVAAAVDAAAQSPDAV